MRSLLRLCTAGSVDDGKSTLIGRLLVDSKAVLQDHLAGVQRQGQTDLALLTDGLSAEREQGITIDVAYRYFSTEARKFIIGDDCIENWRDYIDVIAGAISDNGGRSCINASAVVVPKYAAEIADALAKKLGTVKVDMGDTDCKVPNALQMIEKIESMGRIGLKRKTMKC